MDFLQDQLIRVLVRDLVDEPFAQKHQFLEKDLESICQFIQSAFDTEEGQTQSYQKTRDVLCLILCHLDLLGLSEMPKVKLAALIDKSPFQDAVDFFRGLKTNGSNPLSTSLLDRLIGQHLCLELENQANSVLKPILISALPERDQLIQNMFISHSNKLHLNEYWQKILEQVLDPTEVNRVVRDTFRSWTPPDNQLHEKHFPLEQLGVLALVLGLNSALAKLLIGIGEKKKRSLSWENKCSDLWLRELERDFELARQHLTRSLGTEFFGEKAA